MSIRVSACLFKQVYQPGEHLGADDDTSNTAQQDTSAETWQPADQCSSRQQYINEGADDFQNAGGRLNYLTLARRQVRCRPVEQATPRLLANARKPMPTIKARPKRPSEPFVRPRIGDQNGKRRTSYTTTASIVAFQITYATISSGAIILCHHVKTCSRRPRRAPWWQPVNFLPPISRKRT